MRKNRLPTPVFLGFPCGSAGKESVCNVGDLGSIPGLGRSPGKGQGYPLQYSGLENSMDCTVHEMAKSRTQLRGFHSHTCINIISPLFLFSLRVPFLKSLSNFLQYCSVSCFVFLTMRHILSSLTRDRTCTPCIERQSLSRWTVREVLAPHS